MNCDKNRVLVAAHRGHCQCAPENSLEAVASSLALGVDILEIDIRRTRDGELVVMHDRTLDRTTTGFGPIHDLPWRDIQTLRLKDHQGKPTPHRIPRLAEVLTLAKDRCLVCLDKSLDYLPQTLNLLKDTNTLAQAIFFGDAPAHQVRPMFGHLFAPIRYMPQLMVPTSDYIQSYVQECHPWAFMARYESENSALLPLLPAIQQAGIHVWVSPLKPSMCAGRTDALALQDPDGHWGWVIARGADIICTNHPAELLTYLRQKGWHA
ncbi:MAG: glycerophosphodiester phosphodiesterase family protein [Phycisphaeraceae bacterium]|nr:glycerophosphodiester phosphodiesterase family protein [Phycisphaeraceae bacterium]